MANRAAQGVVGVPFAMDIERGKVREFAEATKSANPAYWHDDRPVIPPTFLITQMFWERWAGEAAFPWPLVELDQRSGMHAEQEFVFFGPPPRAGVRLTAQSRIGDIYSKQSRAGGTLTFAVMITEFRDESGRLVAEARLTGVETSSRSEDQSPATTEPPAAPPAAPDATPAPSASVPPPPAPLVVGPLAVTDFVRYQGASGDMNPLHHDTAFATEAGYHAPLAIGMLNAGLLATYATDWLGAEAIRKFRIRFRDRVWPGDTVTCFGSVIREYERGDARLVDVDLACASQDGTVAVQAWATFERAKT